MKLIQILGAVVAAHIALFMFIFAVPGCRSSGHAPAPADTAPPLAGAPNDGYASIEPAPSLAAGDLNPAVASAGDFISPAPENSMGVRYSPTRPGTPAAASLQTAPVADVLPASTYTVARGDSLWTIAKKHGISVRELAAANNLSSTATLKIDQKLVVPGAAAAAAATATPAAAAGSTYTVVPGDSLAKISKKTGVSVAELRSANRLQGDLVRIGQVLSLPAGAVGAESAAPATPMPTAASTSVNGGLKHVVAPGETLGGIARKYQVKVGEIATVNHITDPTKLRAGQELTIPGASAAPAPASNLGLGIATPSAAALPTMPPPEQDLDAGLKPDAGAVPVIEVEDNGAPSIP